MKVLYISALFPYPQVSGGHQRIHHLLSRLSEKNEIDLISFVRNSPSNDDVMKVATITRRSMTIMRGSVWQLKYLFRSLVSKDPLLVISYSFPEAQKIVRETIEQGNYDLIHCEPYYVINAVPKEYRNKVIGVAHNIEYSLYEKFSEKYKFLPFINLLMKYDVYKLTIFEKNIWKSIHKLICVSEDDKKMVEKLSARSDVQVVNNGVDINEFSYKKFRREVNNLVFVGTYNWFPNTEAVKLLIRKVWPAIKTKYSQLQLIIVGKHLPKSLQDQAIKNNIEVKGWVEDIRVIYWHALALISPMQISGGTKFKVIEAMACGCPVIGTPQTFEGLEQHNKQIGFVVNKDSDYEQYIHLLQSSYETALMVTKNARSFIEKNYSWDNLANKLNTIWQRQ